jgi:hypothetical protein
MAIYIARCHMTLHDNLYYASREFGRFYETEKYLHNYGLTYALGLVQPAPAYFNVSFEFFVFAQEKGHLPRWVRLGKWMAKAEILHKWYEVGTEAAQDLELKQPQIAACPINPLDIPRNRLSSFDIVVMPPASLLTNSRITGPCCKLAADEFFHDRKKEDRYVPLYMSYFGGETKTR